MPVKAIMLPSGDHTGKNSKVPAVPAVTNRGLEPSAFMTITSRPPNRRVWKVIWLPSGDHIAWASSPGELVSRVGLVPSVFIT